MFRRHNDAVFMDLSLDLRDAGDWKVGPLRAIDFPQNITALATEPISGLLAIGTAGGTVYLFGAPGVETRLAIPDTVSVKFLQFAPSTFQLVCLDELSLLHVWDLANYGQPKLVKSVRFDGTNPEVTALTIHPAGHFFAVGYADGSIAFWAIEDEEKPLLLRTLDELDVNMVDQDRLEEYISHKGKAALSSEREPIFKLSWSGFSNSSDPRGGKTVLAILGGLNEGEAAGITLVQFPAFNPPEPPAPTSPNHKQSSLHPAMRQAMRDSLDVLDSYFYFTRGVIQDYLLIPQKSPHFAGTFDPIAIVMLTEGPGNTRTLEAYQYPPSALSDAPQIPASSAITKLDPLNSIAADLAETLKDLDESNDPKRLLIPASLSHGNSGIIGGHLVKIEKETYQTLAAGKISKDLNLPLNGGQAWADESKDKELRLAKVRSIKFMTYSFNVAIWQFQPHRILITTHRDLTVCFDDTSAQILSAQRPTSLQSSFPDPYPDLTIDLRPVLLDPIVANRTSPTLIKYTQVDAVYFAIEALETTVLLNTGEIILYRLSGPRHPSAHRDAPDAELIILDHISSDRGFSPYLMLVPGLGPAEACAVSDIGFLAVAYFDAVYIINMRGPQIVLRHVAEHKHVKVKHVVDLIPGHSDSDKSSQHFSLDPERNVRLIVAKASGHYDIYTLYQTGMSAQPWKCEGPVTVDGGISHAIPRGLFVIDGKKGLKLSASHINLALAGPGGPKVPSILVMVGAKGAKSFANLNGERLGKVEWGHKVGEVIGVQIIEKLGSHVLVVATNKLDALVYSLPHLEFIMTLKLPLISLSAISLDESGDFIAWTSHTASGTMHQATYGTLFDIRRAYDLPDIDLACTKPVVPAAPQPVSAGPASMLQLGSWLPFSQSMTGAQLDELLGGPNRPIPRPEQQPTLSFYSSADISAGASEVAAAAAATQANLYNRLTSALGERGQVLNDLEQRFNALGESSQNMVSQAKRLAAQQTAKSWFGL
ncbi:hypothetical protein H0H87_012084 [Tephrocybe sp. NHM501043]|nr:hypothetical protein H0H87_012084 [Tephrocybe sp. NHM501043]